jgi:hypothetical protein
MRVPETNAGAVALAERTGMAPVRWWSELDRDLTQPITPALVPAGLTVASLGPPYDAARWDEPLRAAHNSAFADHWGSAPVSRQAWVHWRTGSRSFRPGCSAVATTAGGEIAGYVLGYEYDADTERTGRRDLYIATVGTIAAHRRPSATRGGGCPARARTARGRRPRLRHLVAHRRRPEPDRRPGRLREGGLSPAPPRDHLRRLLLTPLIPAPPGAGRRFSCRAPGRWLVGLAV